MFPLQLERGQVVVKCCGSPAPGCMALTAIHSKAALVRLIVKVTGITVLKCRREIAQSACIDMTLHTCQANMLARELERENVVIKILPEAIHAVVAIETGRAKGDRMRGHESQIHLTVASIASIESEGRDLALVAIVAGERFTRSRKLVAL